jgi:ubiquinone/menaquinone biosynthesis C-methylase UbiE
MRMSDPLRTIRWSGIWLDGGMPLVLNAFACATGTWIGSRIAIARLIDPGCDMPQHEPWQLEGSAAELYERYLVPAITALWATDLLERVAPAPGERVLDVACGTGIVARLAARRMSRGQIVGLDLNPGMLSVARAISTGHQPPIEWREGSALALPFGDDGFDVVLCQLGLQFFPDRTAALREMFRVLAPEGRLGLNVYTAIERTPVALALAEALDQHLGPGASMVKRSEHALADAEELRRLIVDAGFCDVILQPVTQTIRFTSPREYVRLQIAATPMAAMVAGMESDRRDSVVDAITSSLVSRLDDAGGGDLASPQEAFVVRARKGATSSLS